MVRGLTRAAVLAATTIAYASFAGPAAAEFVCAGTESTIVACLNTDAVQVRLEPYHDCVYLGGPECVPVELVRPATYGEGCLIYWRGELGDELFGACR